MWKLHTTPCQTPLQPIGGPPAQALVQRCPFVPGRGLFSAVEETRHVVDNRTEAGQGRKDAGGVGQRRGVVRLRGIRLPVFFFFFFLVGSVVTGWWRCAGRALRWFDSGDFLLGEGVDPARVNHLSSFEAGWMERCMGGCKSGPTWRC